VIETTIVINEIETVAENAGIVTENETRTKKETEATAAEVIEIARSNEGTQIAKMLVKIQLTRTRKEIETVCESASEEGTEIEGELVILVLVQLVADGSGKEIEKEIGSVTDALRGNETGIASDAEEMTHDRANVNTVAGKKKEISKTKTLVTQQAQFLQPTTILIIATV
jgi:hypothetical protein